MIIGGTYRLLINVRVVFNYMDEEMARELIVSLIQSRLEYTAVVWSPYKNKKSRIRKLENIQRAATKILSSLKQMSYETE